MAPHFEPAHAGDAFDEPGPLNRDDFFGPQPVGRAELPDPIPVLRNLAHCVVEALAGARDLEQLARWVTDDVYRGLEKRVALASRARRVRGARPHRPVFAIGTIRASEPADGVVEAVVLVHQRPRTRAIVIRIEGFDARWRASVLGVL